jgi:hypothetical protein
MNYFDSTDHGAWKITVAAEWCIENHGVRTWAGLIDCLKKDLQVVARRGGEKGEKAQGYLDDFKASNIYLDIISQHYVIIISIFIQKYRKTLSAYWDANYDTGQREIGTTTIPRLSSGTASFVFNAPVNDVRNTQK